MFRKVTKSLTMLVLFGLCAFLPIGSAASAFATQDHSMSKNKTSSNQKCNEFCVTLNHHIKYATGGKTLSKKYSQWTKKHDPKFLDPFGTVVTARALKNKTH